MPRVGIVIVTYNSEQKIGPCLDAALSSGAAVIVVDNASTDRTREEVSARGARMIANPANRGFAGAVNQGVRALDSPYILLLNPDAVLETSIDPLADACERPGIAGAAGMLVGEDMVPQTGFMIRRLATPLALSFEALLINRLWPANPVNWQYRCLGLDGAVSQEVEQPAGAFLMIRRDVWDLLGGFDESFHPLWFEDVDFCQRARQQGYRMYYVPRVVAKHTGGHSVSTISLEQRQLYWYGNLLRYAAKHFSGSSERMVCLAVIAGSMLRMVMGIAHRRSLKPLAVFSKIARLAGRRLIMRPAG